MGAPTTSSQARNPPIARQVNQPANVIPRGYPPFGIQTVYAGTLGSPLFLPKFGEGGLGETARIEFRTEFFNVFNHPQFTPGSISPFSPLGGTINSNAATAPAGRFLNPDTVGNDGGGRVIRYQLKLVF